MLARMFGTTGDGVHDRLIDFSRPVSGAYYFAPSLNALSELAGAGGVTGRDGTEAHQRWCPKVNRQTPQKLPSCACFAPTRLKDELLAKQLTVFPNPSNGRSTRSIRFPTGKAALVFLRTPSSACISIT